MLVTISSGISNAEIAWLTTLPYHPMYFCLLYQYCSSTNHNELSIDQQFLLFTIQKKSETAIEWCLVFQPENLVNKRILIPNLSDFSLLIIPNLFWCFDTVSRKIKFIPKEQWMHLFGNILFYKRNIHNNQLSCQQQERWNFCMSIFKSGLYTFIL